MKKAEAAEHFDEHEVDTAKRAYPLTNEALNRTAKISKVDLDTMLRTESGTRASVTSEAIRRHLSAPRQELSLPPLPEPGMDPHSRPTIDVFSTVPVPVAIPISDSQWPPPEPRAPQAGVQVVRPSAPEPSRMSPPPQSAGSYDLARSSGITEKAIQTPAFPSWLLPAVAVGFLLIVLAASTLGYFIGRLSGH